MASEELGHVQERSDRLWDSMTAEQRRDFDNRRDEAVAVLTVARPLIKRHEECREQENAREDNMKWSCVLALLVIAVVLHWLDFKSVAWIVAALLALALIGGPIEVYFIARRRKRLYEQLEEQRYRWIKLGASSDSFDRYFTVVRRHEDDPEVGKERERLWWAELCEELIERVTRPAE
jgi:hypothetical protein